MRFVLLEGLDIQGSGKEGHGLSLDCDRFGKYLYNFCLRDVVVQGCGGDGCRMIGNIFEARGLNCYFRDNRGSGLTMGHGKTGGILSSIHAFGCVFGQNGQHGADLINNAYDVGFHGCYFLLNRAFGLQAGNGCTLLSHCGFENNHEAAPDFARGDAGMKLQGFATLVGCTSYSMHKQTPLLRAFVAGRLSMMGCTGSGGGDGQGRGPGAAVGHVGRQTPSWSAATARCRCRTASRGWRSAAPAGRHPSSARTWRSRQPAAARRVPAVGQPRRQAAHEEGEPRNGRRWLRP